MNTPIHCRKFLRSAGFDAPRGLSCFFLAMTKKVGLKIYHHQETGRKAYALQKLASLHGLAPKCYQHFTFRDGFGYFTETLRVMNFEEFNTLDDGNLHIDARIYYAGHPYHHVYLRLKEIGIIDNDGHAANYGKNDNGEVMLLDFGGFGWNTEYKSPLKKER